MSKFKVGDKVRKVASNHLWSFNKGEELTVTGFSTLGNAWVSNGKESDTAYDSDLELIYRAPETPPATITHEGYTYNRGERVRPEWVKDGAWVVNICSGELRKVKEVKPGVFDLVVNEFASVRYQDAIRDQYRPFTATDWKWGMWAEYKGEKVFVMNRVSGKGVIEFSKSPRDNTSLSGWAVDFACELTPTTDP